MKTNLITEILAFLLGRKYYVNIVITRGTTKQEFCSFVFTTREGAARHAEGLRSTRTFAYVETNSIRSRKIDYINAVKNNPYEI